MLGNAMVVQLNGWNIAFPRKSAAAVNNLRTVLFRVIAVVIWFDESLITFVVNWGNVRGLYYISGQLFYLWYTSELFNN